MSESLGNWRKDELDSLWNSERMQRLRYELAKGKVASECLKYESCPIVQAYVTSRKKTVRRVVIKKKNIFGKLDGLFSDIWHILQAYHKNRKVHSNSAKCV